MSLVHRSWTRPAQRAIRRAFRVYANPGLSLLLRNPLVGPWTRHICVEWFNPRFPQDADRTFYLLTVLPHVAPNVESLSLLLPFEPGPRCQYVLDVIKSLSRFRYLKRLSLGNNTEVSLPLDDLCEVLSRLPLLNFLSLRRWQPTLPTLEVLVIDELAQNFNEIVNAVLPYCTGLRLLEIEEISRFLRSTHSLSLSTSLQELHLRDQRGIPIDTKPSSEDNWDEMIVAVLSRLPNLRVFTLSVCHLNAKKHVLVETRLLRTESNTGLFKTGVGSDICWNTNSRERT
ncbi:hypothetical protein DFH11DRAFT_1645426 [Phellopilus nigrolimitatus]|nr:hypothetical protein DFH11DRAFT_1645426 [Phellopilus nigrolimitatus]